MHECPDCYQECDCDGEDLSREAPPEHVCINPECGWDGDDFPPHGPDPIEEDDERRARAHAAAREWTRDAP